MENNLMGTDFPGVIPQEKDANMAAETVVSRPEAEQALTEAPDTALPDDDLYDDLDDEDVEPPKKRGRKRKIIISAVALLLVGAVTVYFLWGNTTPTVQAFDEYTYHTVGKRDIVSSLSGSGTLEPADSYSVTALVSGEILSAGFEEGDIVEKDNVLYQIDSSDTQTSIEQAEISLSQSQKSYNQKVESLDDLKIKANGTGTIVSMNVEVGDKVTAGQTIATIRDSSTMTLTIPFGTDDADMLYIGQSAEVVLDGTFERLNGTITKISALEERLDGNRIVRMVTIDVPNPGGISLSHIATASAGGVVSNGSGSFGYKDEKTVTASTSGEVTAVYAEEGDSVQKDSLLVQLESDSLSNEIENSANSLRNEELSLENKYKQLDNYTITSPISGTIIEKYYKEGDKLDTGKTLCTIFDLSYLTMTLNVDELDIASIEVGQEVTVTAEALGDKEFKGVVTRININGTTVNGVTSYPVTVRIDETDGLLPGMNVQAEIVVSSSRDVIAIPVSALSRGNRVLVKTGGGGATDGANIPDGAPQGGQPQFNGGDLPDINAEDLPQFDAGNMPQFDAGSMQPQTGAVMGQDGLPEGYEYVVVTTGVSDENYIEITSGLSEGDEIAYIADVNTGNNDFFMPGGTGEVVTFEMGSTVPAGSGSFSGGPRY